MSGETTTSGNGGTVYVTDSAEFVSGRLSKECWDTDRCNTFSNNLTGASGSGWGGAIFNQGGSVEVFLS